MFATRRWQNVLFYKKKKEEDYITINHIMNMIVPFPPNFWCSLLIM